jgi:hypothetical protein
MSIYCFPFEGMLARSIEAAHTPFESPAEKSDAGLVISRIAEARLRIGW